MQKTKIRNLFSILIVFLIFVQAHAQLKIFPLGNTTIGTLTQINTGFRLQVDAGNIVNSNASALYLKCLGHTSDWGYCQVNNVNRTNAKVFEGQLNGTSKFYIRGDGTHIWPSDSLLKINVEPLENSLDHIKRLRAYSYNFVDEYSYTTNKRIGFLAQQLERVIPDIVSMDDQTLKGIDYVSLIPILADAIKELNSKVDELERQIENCCSSSLKK